MAYSVKKISKSKGYGVGLYNSGSKGADYGIPGTEITIRNFGHRWHVFNGEQKVKAYDYLAHAKARAIAIAEAI